jgi:N-acetyl sugar amidotransferase
MNEYKICKKCIMDTSDPDITFEKNGVCSHCYYFEKVRKVNWFPNKEGAAILDNKISEIKGRRKNCKYDCMIGLSGGVDSSYLAYILKKDYNLRILAVHVDAGWNSELAVSNIENIVKKLDIDLFTVVVDWEEMRNLQLAFLKSGVVNQDTPQDHAFFAGLYIAAKRFGIKDFLVGQNIQTESILPKSWQGLSAMDTRQLKYISRKFGKQRLRKFPVVSFYEQHIFYPRIYGFEKLIPLNYMPYNKSQAKSIIIKELGWRDYGVKHGESKWTKFYQSYFLPVRCGFDKRRAHLSSLILAGEISREEALKDIKELVYASVREIEDDKEYVAKKLQISVDDMNSFLDKKCIHFNNYPNSQKFLEKIRFIKKVLSIK